MDYLSFDYQCHKSYDINEKFIESSSIFQIHSHSLTIYQLNEMHLLSKYYFKLYIELITKN